MSANKLPRTGVAWAQLCAGEELAPGTATFLASVGYCSKALCTVNN